MYDCLLPALPWLCRLHRYLVVMAERATSRAHLKFSPDKTMTTNWLTRYTLTHRFHGRQQKKMEKKKIRALFDLNLKSGNSACKRNQRRRTKHATPTDRATNFRLLKLELRPTLFCRFQRNPKQSLRITGIDTYRRRIQSSGY